MILDTSAVIAIIQREPGWQQLRSQLGQAPLLRISAGTLQELLVVAHCQGVLEAVEDLLLLLDADVVPVDGDLARRACRIFQRFGKGQGHAAQLNFGDCFAAALAERDQAPLAYTGDDFRTAGY
jgi:ribonuclease VapC